MDCAIYRKKSQRSVFIIVLNNVQLMMKNALELTRRNLFTKWLKNLLQLNQTVSYSEALPLHENETFSFHFSNFSYLITKSSIQKPHFLLSILLYI